MPCYEYSNPENPEEKHVVFEEMDKVHEYEFNGVKWDRVWTAPAIGFKVDPNSERQFLEQTSKPGTMGDIWDRAKELSHLRAEKHDGVDPVKEESLKKKAAKDEAIKAAARAKRIKKKA